MLSHCTADGGPVAKKGGKTETDPPHAQPPASDDKVNTKKKTADIIEKDKETDKEKEKEKEKE